MSKPIKITILALIIITISIVGAVTYVGREKTYRYNGETLIQDKKYHHIEPDGVTCQALTSECGYCRGQVVDKICYVPKQ